MDAAQFTAARLLGKFGSRGPGQQSLKRGTTLRLKGPIRWVSPSGQSLIAGGDGVRIGSLPALSDKVRGHTIHDLVQ